MTCESYVPGISYGSRSTVLHYVVNTSFAVYCAIGSIQMTVAHFSKACWSSFFLKFQNKDLGAASQTLLTGVKLRLLKSTVQHAADAVTATSPQLQRYLFLSGRGKFLIFTVT